ncbi:hypothetical protein C210_30290 [Klebsiella pneumoniae subsp. pneumoniae KpMDU1]|nr:hypothetical protein C210_30290 [Klebsiella pneumoniae subsp. pneumoniae KpMDU1]
MLLNPGLCTSFGHFFTPISLSLSIQFIHLVLSQFQYSTEPFVINDLPLVDAFQFIEDLIIE